MEHGTPCHCGSCGAPGRWDKMENGTDKMEAEFHDAVFFNDYERHIECYECWLK